MFLSTPPSRVATYDNLKGEFDKYSFYPRHPRGWRPVRVSGKHQAIVVSIHATLAGGDSTIAAQTVAVDEFLSTPPSRVATCFAFALVMLHPLFLSTPPSRVATDDRVQYNGALYVSIHATLAGGDASCAPVGCTHSGFYPRHPRGWRQVIPASRIKPLSFLSTPPSRVATWRAYINSIEVMFLSTPPSRVATLAL